PAAYFHHDGLLHLGRDNLADLLVFQSFCGFGFGHVICLPPQFPARAVWYESGPDPSSSREVSSAPPSVPWTSEIVDGTSAHPFPATDASIRFRPDREPSAPSYPLFLVFPSLNLCPSMLLLFPQPHVPAFVRMFLT